MVSAIHNRPRAQVTHFDLVGTDQASQRLRVPCRTLRRWVKNSNLGIMVAGRRVLTQADMRLLELMRDGAGS